MSKKIKSLIIIILSIIISASISYILINFPDFEIFPMKYDEKIPNELAEELNLIERLSNIMIAQHGYHHTENVSRVNVMKGYKILECDNSLDVKFYIPPYEIIPSYPTPEEVFIIPNETRETYKGGGADYGKSFPNGEKTIGIHIQDNITLPWLNEISDGKDFKYIRIDDVNTDIVDVEDQINRIYTLISFCSSRNCSLVLGVIPVVPRMCESDKNYLFFNKTMIGLGIMLILPLYLFYFLSYHFRGWFK